MITFLCMVFLFTWLIGMSDLIANSATIRSLSEWLGLGSNKVRPKETEKVDWKKEGF